MITVHVVG